MPRWRAERGGRGGKPSGRLTGEGRSVSCRAPFLARGARPVSDRPSGADGSARRLGLRRAAREKRSARIEPILGRSPRAPAKRLLGALVPWQSDHWMTRERMAYAVPVTPARARVPRASQRVAREADGAPRAGTGLRVNVSAPRDRLLRRLPGASRIGRAANSDAACEGASAELDASSERGFSGEIPEWPKGSDCKSDGSAFAGSNPALPTSPPGQRPGAHLAGVVQW